MNSLTVSLIQTALHWENIPANLKMFSEKIALLPRTDLIVLPEMFSTGFTTRPDLAETMKESTAIGWMRSTALQKNCAMAGSLIIKDRKKHYNRLVFVRSDGSIEYYDKRHLFSLSNEPDIFAAGNRRIIIDLNGWRICPLICYDLRFPVWSRNSSSPKKQFDVLLYVANWPDKRADAWKQLLVARAIENQCYVVGVNRVGSDGNRLYYSGDSMAVDPAGKTLCHCSHDDAVLTVELNLSELQKLREQHPFLKDADGFTLKEPGRAR
jgi:predicted amidohydrolase